MIHLDYSLINDDRMISALSAAERYAALALEKLRADNLRDKVNEFFSEKRDVIVLNTVKNEERYILEWVAYHRLMGVDGILLMDNDSTDSTPELLSALHREGIVCSAPWPTVHPYEKQQISAFANAVRALQAVDASEWLGFLDVDEFYVSRDFGKLPNALASMAPADAYHLTWQFFGSGGAEKREEGLIIERFQKRGAFRHGKNWQGKPLMKLNAVSGHYHHPHNVKLAEGATYKFPNGASFPGVLPQRAAPNAKALFPEKVASAPMLGIHHYAIRSREEFFEKVGKGRVNYRVNESKIDMADHENYFKGHDINDEHDSVLADMAGEVKEEMSRIIDKAGLQNILPK